MLGEVIQMQPRRAELLPSGEGAALARPSAELNPSPDALLMPCLERRVDLPGVFAAVQALQVNRDLIVQDMDRLAEEAFEAGGQPAEVLAELERGYLLPLRQALQALSRHHAAREELHNQAAGREALFESLLCAPCRVSERLSAAELEALAEQGAVGAKKIVAAYADSEWMPSEVRALAMLGRTAPADDPVWPAALKLAREAVGQQIAIENAARAEPSSRHGEQDSAFAARVLERLSASNGSAPRLIRELLSVQRELAASPDPAPAISALKELESGVNAALRTVRRDAQRAMQGRRLAAMCEDADRFLAGLEGRGELDSRQVSSLGESIAHQFRYATEIAKNRCVEWLVRRASRDGALGALLERLAREECDRLPRLRPGDEPDAGQMAQYVTLLPRILAADAAGRAGREDSAARQLAGLSMPGWIKDWMARAAKQGLAAPVENAGANRVITALTLDLVGYGRGVAGRTDLPDHTVRGLFCTGSGCRFSLSMEERALLGSSV
jgi:hypothetical protein